MKITIQREIEAEQWAGPDGKLPDGCHLCRPEIEMSADGAFVYFTYAELRPTVWMGTSKLPVPEDWPVNNIADFSGITVYTPEKAERYGRKILPFNFWSVKSKSSVTGNHRPVFLEPDDSDMMALWHDYCSHERFPNPIPRRAEYREFGGNYGRGYRPIYMNPGDWLLKEQVPDGHNNLGTKTVVRVVSDYDLKVLAGLLGNVEESDAR